MKKILIISAMILSAICVHAQASMPRELTCTERAFNFSFSLGSKWKMTAPKMGPAEILNDNPAFNPIWRLKAKETTPQEYLWLLKKPDAVQNLLGLNLLHLPQFLVSQPHFTSLINYTFLSGK